MKRVVVIGAGIGGLTAAVRLAAEGLAVTVAERLSGPGGKMRTVDAGGYAIDAGPTVFTLRGVFDALFEQAGASLDDYLRLKPATVLARHAWEEGGVLDLYASPTQTADAIGRFAGAADARGYLSFCREAQAIFRILDRSFVRASKPSLPLLIWRIGPHRFGDLSRINPYQTLWAAVSRHMRDPRLRQLFARYSTYCGASPFAAPATLMLVAEVERQGVWLVEGGMHNLAKALESLAKHHGAVFRYSAPVANIALEHGRAAGVILESGEQIGADAIIVNADAMAVSAGTLGPAAAGAVRPVAPARRSLSALTWAFAAEAGGFPLARHTIFFPSSPYASEFQAIFKDRQLPPSPAVYLCAQDRDDEGHGPTGGAERFLGIVNAPPVTGTATLTQSEIEECETKTFKLMSVCGLTLRPVDGAMVRTAPQDFAALFPGTGGAIYGRVSHGWMASFQRQSSRSRMPGLYFAGGSAHPGPGVPMAALSGLLASEALLASSALTRRWRATATPGGISMPSAPTAATE